jgi:alpha-glucosidase
LAPSPVTIALRAPIVPADAGASGYHRGVAGPEETHRWWQRGVVYQIYPRSFQDSDGDGVGDLAGILARVDYLAWLGVDAVWLSPIFPSPMADFGYDVADYVDVDPLFGSLADLDALLAALHARGIRLLLDFVPNHTSERHPWFVESRSSRSAPKRAWYIWRDARPDGSPPNGFVAAFGGPAWEWDPGTGQYYFHSFLKEQPDLDWLNPEVRAAMTDVLRFWFERGIDGFRIDVITFLGKQAPLVPLPDDASVDLTVAHDPVRAERARAQQVWGDEPTTHELVAAIRAVSDHYEDRVLVGEIYEPLERLVVYYGSAGDGLHLPFNFQLITLPWEAAAIGSAIDRYEALLPASAWPNWVLGNHDKPRIATRAGEGQARVAAMLLLTLRGTPTIYYGDELGMPNVAISHEQERDPAGIREPGQSRDPARTPMRWDASATSGFTTGRPWLPMGPRVAELNVQAERADPGSVLNLYRGLLELRRAEPALSIGEYRGLGVSGDVLAYERASAAGRFLIVLNLGPEGASLPGSAQSLRGRVELATDLLDAGAPFDGRVPLPGNRGLIVRLSG